MRPRPHVSSANVTSREYNIERFDKVLLSEGCTPRWYVVASFFGYIIEKGGNPGELPVAKDG
jgi:hypothetical protein